MLITNARVVDGAGNPWFRADVGIRGDRIADVGDLAGRDARRIIDVADRVVTPHTLCMPRSLPGFLGIRFSLEECSV